MTQLETCVMLTHITGGGRPSVCGRDVAVPDRWPAGHPMCPAHCDQMERWAHRRHVDLTEQAFARRVESEMAAHAAAEAQRAASSVVYFLQRADGHIKIGFSSQFRDRLSTLTRQFGPLETLWTMKGGRDLERRHHEQFADERVGNTEWFRPSQRLVAYIDRVELGPLDAIEASDEFGEWKRNPDRRGLGVTAPTHDLCLQPREQPCRCLCGRETWNTSARCTPCTVKTSDRLAAPAVSDAEPSSSAVTTIGSTVVVTNFSEAPATSDGDQRPPAGSPRRAPNPPSVHGNFSPAADAGDRRASRDHGTPGAVHDRTRTLTAGSSTGTATRRGVDGPLLTPT